MFNRQTLFVVGAGASHELGFPLGIDLAARIRHKMDICFDLTYSKPSGTGDYKLFESVTQNYRYQPELFQNAALLMRTGLGFAQSIDDFLDQHRTNAHVNLYGKAAIIKSILEAEHESKLFVEYPETLNPEKIANTWAVKFIYMLSRSVSREDVCRIFNRVAFVVFNYDRCIEHFLLHALQAVYAIRPDEAQSIVDDLHIIHPYGVIPESTPFGDTRANYRELAKEIKTYTEQLANTDALNAIRTEITRAQCIVFLGFAYHSQNVRMLKPAERISPRPVYGTAYNMSNADVEVVSHNVAISLFTAMNKEKRERHIKLENMKSVDLFDHYSKSLSGGD